MREAGAPSTEEVARVLEVCPSHGVVMFVPPRSRATRRGRNARAALKRMVPPSAAKGNREDGARKPRPDVLTKELQ